MTLTRLSMWNERNISTSCIELQLGSGSDGMHSLALTPLETEAAKCNSFWMLLALVWPGHSTTRIRATAAVL